MRLNPTYIQWHDATAVDTWVAAKDAACTLDEMIVDTIGYLIQQDEHVITIAHSIGADVVRGVISIPKSCVINIVDLTADLPLGNDRPKQAYD